MTSATGFAVIRNSQSGDLVLSIADVLDRLDSDAGREQLRNTLKGMLASDPAEVRPGNLITSAWAVAIQGRLARLESLAGVDASTGRASGVLADAWKVFRALSANGSFLPGASTADAVMATLRVKQYLDNVSLAALVGSLASLGSKALDSTRAFELLYQVEHELVLAFLSPIPGVADTSSHRLFANALLPLVDPSGSPGLTPLKTAVDTGDLDAAIAAQTQINRAAANFGGEAVSGNVNVVYRGSGPEGESLVVGATKPFTFKFDVANRTNRKLEVRLKAEFLDPHKDWTQNASVIDANGNALAVVALDKFDAGSAAGWSQQVRVAVTTPAGAAAGAKGTLRLIAGTTEPVALSHFDQHDIPVTAAATPSLPATASFTAESPVPSIDPSSVPVDTRLMLSYGALLSVQQGATTRDFNFRINILEPAAPDNQFEIAFAPKAIDANASGAREKVSAPFALSHAAGPFTLVVVVKPKAAAAGKKIRFTARLQCVADAAIFAQTPETTITVP